MTAATAIEIIDGEDEVEQAARARVGSSINGKWRLDALLGLGTMGAVYEATHRNGNRVAIKVLHARHSADAELTRRLKQEACLVNAIDHPGVVRIFDDGRTDDGAIYLIMELLDGEGLHARLARSSRQLSPSEALGIASGVLDVLDAAHRKNIVHCDIKPENVFITRRGEIRLLDFGVAGIFSPSRVSASTQLHGTPGYMAPEQALGQADKVDARTDLWAVGALLFRMLTGRTVHAGPSLIEQLVDASTRSVAPFATLMVGAEPELTRLMDRALAFDQADRFPDAAQMQEAVRHCAQSGSSVVPPRVPVLAAKLTPSPELRVAGPEAARDLSCQSGTLVVQAPPQERPVNEPTMRIPRSRPVGGKMLLLVAGGAAMAAASLVGMVDSKPRSPTLSAGMVAAQAALGSPEPTAAPMPEVLANDGQHLIKLTPLAPPAASEPPAAPVVRRAKATRRSRPTASVVRNDDVWGRRH
jgi:eukaryotic-like serine/threonine-protein kinase